MELNFKWNDSDVTVLIKGQIDTTTAPTLDEEVSKVISKANNIIFDFSDVTYISSAGLRVLLLVHKKQDERKHLFTLKNVNNEIKTIFEMTGFNSFLNIQ